MVELVQYCQSDDFLCNYTQSKSPEEKGGIICADLIGPKRRILLPQEMQQSAFGCRLSAISCRTEYDGWLGGWVSCVEPRSRTRELSPQLSAFSDRKSAVGYQLSDKMRWVVGWLGELCRTQESNPGAEPTAFGYQLSAISCRTKYDGWLGGWVVG